MVLVAEIFHEVTGCSVEYSELYEVVGVLEAELILDCDIVLEVEMGVEIGVEIGVEVLGLGVTLPTLTQ